MSIKLMGFPLVCACAVLSACSGGSSSTAPMAGPAAMLQARQSLGATRSVAATQPVQSVRADVRFGLSRETLEAALLSRGAGVFPESAKAQPILFVSDLDSQMIRLYPANVKNPAQEGSITQGLNEPINVAVDKQGTLYVANNGNSTVTEYRLGEKKPSVTLSTSLVYPNGIAVDSKGTVYVTSGADVGSCYILEFPKGSTNPTVQVNGFGLPIGLAVDKDDNLYVADADSSKYVVWEVPKGSTSPKNLNLPGLADPTGVAISPADNLYVSNDSGGTVLGFVLGKKAPFVTISSGLNGPYSLGFEGDGTLFVGNSLTYPGDVAGYKKNKTMPFEMLANGIGNPAGIAVYPAPQF